MFIFFYTNQEEDLGSNFTGSTIRLREKIRTMTPIIN